MVMDLLPTVAPHSVKSLNCPKAQAETEEASGGFFPIVKAFGVYFMPVRQISAPSS